MKLALFALDFDGTLADAGRLGSENRRALIDARRNGIAVVLVTGRILGELARVFGHFGLFDAIVAENGAVLHFPRTGRSTLLVPAPDPSFAAELTRRGVPHVCGECVVELDGQLAPVVLAIVRELELPLSLLFNRGRLMVLPQAVSKGTGLAEAARALRISLHNALAVGDAENDHDLLRVCEFGVAVAWGSAVLKRRADEVLEGAGPPSVAGLLQRFVAEGRLPFARVPRRNLQVGTRTDGASLTLGVVGRNVLIAGAAQSGKSWLAGLLCEQHVLHHYCVCVVDPEGDYASLEALPGVRVLNAKGGAPALDVIEQNLRFPDVSLVIDLAELGLEEKRVYVPKLLARLASIRRRTGYPHRIVVDEAHYFLRDGASARILDRDLQGYTFVTFRVSELDAEVLASTDVVMVTHESDADELKVLRGRVGSRSETTPNGSRERWDTTLSSLELDEAALLPGIAESGAELVRFRIARRVTSHVRHKHKYMATPAAASKSFVFRRAGHETGQTAASLQELTNVLSSAPEQVFAEHLAHGDFSRWIRDVFHDRELADEVANIESSAQAGARSRPHDRIVRAILRRYADNAEAPVAPGDEVHGPRTA